MNLLERYGIRLWDRTLEPQRIIVLRLPRPSVTNSRLRRPALTDSRFPRTSNVLEFRMAVFGQLGRSFREPTDRPPEHNFVR
jgi:hypothetical protein